MRIRRSDVGSLYTCIASSAAPLLLGPPVQELAHALVRGRAGVSIRMWGNDNVRCSSRKSQSGQEQTSKCNYAPDTLGRHSRFPGHALLTSRDPAFPARHCFPAYFSRSDALIISSRSVGRFLLLR